jgi:hypothetical protein
MQTSKHIVAIVVGNECRRLAPTCVKERLSGLWRRCELVGRSVDVGVKDIKGSGRLHLGLSEIHDSPRLVRNMLASLQLDRTLIIISITSLSHFRSRSDTASDLKYHLFVHSPLRCSFAPLDCYKRILGRTSVHLQSQRINSTAPDSYHE